MIILNGNELAHYGVLGMKWGVRRYQNKDGTLTPEGRRRSQKNKSTSTATKKEPISMAELRDRVERLRLEKELKNLTAEELNRGKSKTKKILENVGTTVLTTALTGAALYGLKTVLSGDKTIDRKAFASAVAKGSVK